jgi:lysophospholipase L1-like esterase
MTSRAPGLQSVPCSYAGSSLPRADGAVAYAGTAVPRAARRTLPALLACVLCLLAACGTKSVGASAPVATSGAVHQLVYVAIGASDSFGVGTDDPDRESWPSVLAGQLGPTVHLINLGIPGERVGDALQNELPIALDQRPQVITVWLGVNDLAAAVPLDEYRQQLATLLTTLRQRTHARIAVGNLPDLTLLPFFAKYDQAALQYTVAAWNAAIAADCAQAGVTLVDVYSGWAELAQHPEYLASDGLHPSTLGAARLAALFAAALHGVP